MMYRPSFSMLFLLLFMVAYGGYAYVTDDYLSVIVATVGLFYLLWCWLTMSASSQTSSLSEHVNAIRTNKLTNTTSSYQNNNNNNNNNNNYYGEDCLRRQETVLEKQTVRITPPSYADGPKSTVIIEKRKVPVNGYGNISPRSQTSSEIKNCLQSATDGYYILNRVESNLRLLVDKECQTDDFSETRKTTSIKSTNMDDSGECSSYDFTLNTNEQVPPCDDVDNYTNKTSDDYYHSSVREAERTESKDREIEHIDVIVNESRYTPDMTDEVVLELDVDVADDLCAEKKEENEPEIESAEIRLNGFLAEPEIEVKKSENSKLKEDDDDDSCCVNCLYVSLNICDCVIL